MTAIIEPTLSAEQAEMLEAAFLGGLEEAQTAYERIVQHEAWTLLGFDSFGEWWDQRAVPAMRALSMRPTHDVAVRALEQIRREEEALPALQRSTNRELVNRVGVSDWTVRGRQDQRERRTAAPEDLEEPKPVELPKHQGHADVSLAAFDVAVAAKASEPKPEPQPEDHAETDARLTAELDEIMSGTDVRFRRNFAEAKVKARQILEFDVERINNLFAGNWDRDVGDILNALEHWISDVRDNRKSRQRANLRVVNGGRA